MAVGTHYDIPLSWMITRVPEDCRSKQVLLPVPPHIHPSLTPGWQSTAEIVPKIGRKSPAENTKQAWHVRGSTPRQPRWAHLTAASWTPSEFIKKREQDQRARRQPHVLPAQPLTETLATRKSAPSTVHERPACPQAALQVKLAGKAILLVLNTACQRESRHVACLACSFSQGNPARWFLHLPIRIGTSATAAKGHMLGKNSGVWRTVAPFNSSWALESGLQEKFILIIVRSDGANDRERKTHLPPVPSLYSCSSPTLQTALSSLKLSNYILNFISLAELTFPGATGEPWSSTSAVLNFYGFHFAMFIPQTVIT